MFAVSGLEFRVESGRKEPVEVDLRLEVYTSVGWYPVDMALAQFLTDFFTDNEQALKPFRTHWQMNGDSYFMTQLGEAVRYGWQVPAQRTARQRAAR